MVMRSNKVKNWMREAFKKGEKDKIPADILPLVEASVAVRKEIIEKLTKDKKGTDDN